jgi:hypothetical protein
MSEDNDLDFDSMAAEMADDMGIASDTDDTNDDLDLTVEGEATDEPEAEAEENTEGEEAEAEQEAQPERNAPKSWAQDKHEVWKGLPDAAKDYIELREKQMLDGIEQYKTGHEYASWIDQAIRPYHDLIQQAGVNEAQAIMNLFEHHKAITQGSLEQRQQAFIKIGQMTGLIPQEGQKQPDPMVSQLQQEINAIKAKESEREQSYRQQVTDRINREVAEFAAKSPYFNELENDISQLISAGYDLQTAYEKAVWANPATRAKEMARLDADKKETAKKEAELARKRTSANIKGSTSMGNSAAIPKGAMFDEREMSRIFDSLQ